MIRAVEELSIPDKKEQQKFNQDKGREQANAKPTRTGKEINRNSRLKFFSKQRMGSVFIEIVLILANNIKQ